MDTEYKFHWWNLDAMRAFIYRQTADKDVKRSRLAMFDNYRYTQEYEKIYSMVTHFGGTIEYKMRKNI